FPDQDEYRQSCPSARTFSNPDRRYTRATHRSQGIPAERDQQTLRRPRPNFRKGFLQPLQGKGHKNHLGRLKRRQLIMARCETDVCVLQSCLGLLNLGYEVFVMEELIFSSSRNVDAAITRMKAEGVIFITYKSLFYELIESVDGPLKTFESFPDDLPDSAV